MPLSRVEVRNEYGLGAPILYENANDEDPKAVLEGVEVAGLVGILRQLGDLAEFAAEVFHDLQEEVIITSSRSRKLMARVRQIDKALPSLEKAVLAQRSHLHLAYTAGCNWHAGIKCGQSHFACGDAPQLIMDSYEDCRSPPRLHLLDKFDPGGPGSCLRRYSDPTLFKRASTGYREEFTKKIEKDREVHRTEIRSSRLRNRKISRGASIPNHSVRMQFPRLNVDDQDSASQTAPRNKKTLRPDFVDQPKIESRNELGYIECVISPSYSTKPNQQECRESPSSSKRQSNVSPSCNFVQGKGLDVHDDSQNNFSVEKIGYSPSVTWVEKEEMHEPVEDYDRHENLELVPTNFGLEMHECKESLSPSRREFGDPPGCNFLEENYSDVYDDTRNSLLLELTGRSSSSVNWDEDTRNSLSLERTGRSSSSVNWDEKEEILECTEDYDCDENLGSFPSNLGLEMHGCKADNFKIFEQIDVPPCNGIVPVPESGDNQLDDHHFMDALDTIQSEYETDKDCTTKHELQHYSDLEDKAVIDETRGFETHESEYHSPNIEPDIPENKSLINGIDGCHPTSGNGGRDPISESPHTASASYPVSSKHSTHLQPTQKACELLNPRILQGVDSQKNDNIYDEEKAELVFSKVSSSHSVEDTSRMPIIDRATSSSESQVPAPEPSSSASVMFWTNGGLLGLEPSKPPDYSVLNGITRDHMTGEDGKAGTYSQSSILSSNKDEGKPDPVGNSDDVEHGINMDCTTSYQEYQDGTSCGNESLKHSSVDSNVNLENFSDSTNQNHDNTQSVNLEVQIPEEHHKNYQSSSQMSELDNRLTNSLAMYENYGTTNDVKADVLKQDNNPIVAHQTFSKDLAGARSPIMSPSSSPPLERMKILFCPIQDFEMSKLKLKFSDGNGKPESSRDFFPSFQLVPEPDFAWHNVGSDSEDHTFCSSSPSVSDDCCSHQSESNSEQWESSECPSNKDGDLCNALYRISFADSISTENGSTIHGEMYDSTELRFHHSLNLPSLDSLNHSNHAIDLKLSATKISQQPQSTPLQQDKKFETIDLPKGKQSDVQKNRPKETNQAARGKSMDEQGDVLSQIRTKSTCDFRSISLRPTVSTKPTTPSGPTANANITAILVKANAIRQAVGSDDDGEDDDNWSDT